MHLPVFVPLAAVLLISVAIIILDLRYGLLKASDRFSSECGRGVAYAWLGVFLLFMMYELILSTGHIPTREKFGKMPFSNLFLCDLLCAAFLLSFWRLTR